MISWILDFDWVTDDVYPTNRPPVAFLQRLAQDTTRYNNKIYASFIKIREARWPRATGNGIEWGTRIRIPPLVYVAGMGTPWTGSEARRA